MVAQWQLLKSSLHSSGTFSCSSCEIRLIVVHALLSGLMEQMGKLLLIYGSIRYIQKITYYNLKIMRFFYLFLLTIVWGKIPKILWTYWDSGFENAPLITKLCSQNHHYYLSKDWQIRQINENSVQDWLSKIPNYSSLPNLDHFTHKHQAKANFIRIYLLRYFGGVWIDANTILLEDFSWLDNLSDSQNIVNEYGEEPKLFMFYLSYYGSKEKYHDGKKQWKLFPGLQTWFIAAQPQAEFISDWIDEYTLYAQNGMKYKINRISKQNIVLGGLGKDNYLSTSEAIQYVLQMKQRELDQKYGLEDRKLAVNYYKIWTMEASSGPLKLQKNHLNWNSFELARDLTKVNYSLILDEVKPKYFIKLSAKSYKVLEAYIKNWMGDSSFLLGIDMLKEGSWSYLFHPNSHFVEKDSIVSKYLFDLSHDQTFNPVENSLKRKDISSPHALILLCMVLTPLLFIYFVYLVWSSIGFGSSCQAKEEKERVFEEDIEKKGLGLER